MAIKAIISSEIEDFFNQFCNDNSKLKIEKFFEKLKKDGFNLIRINSISSYPDSIIKQIEIDANKLSDSEKYNIIYDSKIYALKLGNITNSVFFNDKEIELQKNTNIKLQSFYLNYFVLVIEKDILIYTDTNMSKFEFEISFLIVGKSFSDLYYCSKISKP